MAKKKIGDVDVENITMSEAISFAYNLLDWITLKDENNQQTDNIYFMEYCHENNLYDSDIKYLCDKYIDFKKIIDKAIEVQNLKLKGFSSAGAIHITAKDLIMQQCFDAVEAKRKEIDW